jgi:hypothetical protein
MPQVVADHGNYVAAIAAADPPCEAPYPLFPIAIHSEYDMIFRRSLQDRQSSETFPCQVNKLWHLLISSRSVSEGIRRILSLREQGGEHIRLSRFRSRTGSATLQRTLPIQYCRVYPA